MSPDLSSYDIILINTSGGKDSQVMLGEVSRLATEAGVADRLVAVHADLGRVEWEGVADLAKRQAHHYGVRFLKTHRPQGDLLEHVEARGMWPSSAARYCTSDHKRGQVSRIVTFLVDELGLNRPARMLNCMGLRAEESPARAKKVELERDNRASNGRRLVDTWLPILGWTEEQVWAQIRTAGVEHHWAYDAGMPRLSCCFCVLASKSALVRAAQLLPGLAEEYRRVEVKIGHQFKGTPGSKGGLSMAEIIAEAAATDEPAAIANWSA